MGSTFSGSLRRGRSSSRRIFSTSSSESGCSALQSSSDKPNDWFLILFNGDDRSGVSSIGLGIFLFRVVAPALPFRLLSYICIVSFVGVLRPLRFDACAVISLNARLDAPIRPPRSKEDLGVKKRVNDLGVIVGGLRCLLPLHFLEGGRIGDGVGSPPTVDTAVLNGKSSWDP